MTTTTDDVRAALATFEGPEFEVWTFAGDGSDPELYAGAVGPNAEAEALPYAYGADGGIAVVVEVVRRARLVVVGGGA